MPRFLDPFPIAEQSGKVANKLNLSSATLLTDIRPVFHVALLRPFHISNDFFLTFHERVEELKSSMVKDNMK
jgi:hypothetical protein